MNYVYAIFLLYISFIAYISDDTDNIDKLDIFAFMIFFNPLHVFLTQINKILTIIAAAILFYLKFYIQIENQIPIIIIMLIFFTLQIFYVIYYENMNKKNFKDNHDSIERLLNM